jgi:hypothetical protein
MSRRLNDFQRETVINGLKASGNSQIGRRWAGLDLNKLTDDELLVYDSLRRQFAPVENGIKCPGGQLTFNQSLNNGTGDWEFIPDGTQTPPITSGTPVVPVNNCGGGTGTVTKTGPLANALPKKDGGYEMEYLIANGYVAQKDVAKWGYADEAENRAYAELIDRITANWSPEAKKSAAEQLRKMDYDALAQMAAGAPTATPANNQQPAPRPSWAGAAGPGPAPGQVVNTVKPLPTPKYNFAEMRPARS